MKRLIAMAVAIACIFAGASAFAEAPRVIALTTEATQLRSSAAAGAAILAELPAGSPLKLVAKGTSVVTVASRKAPWHKVATPQGQEGFIFGAALKLVDKPMKYKEFGEDALWFDYLKVALRPGERVIAVKEYDSVTEGLEGYWYPSPIDPEDEPAMLVIWDEYLDAQPSPDYLPEGYPTKLMARTWWVDGSVIELVGAKDQADFAALEAEYAETEDPLRLMPPGSVVILGAHSQADPTDEDSRFWADDMDAYVGEETVLVDHQGNDAWDYPLAHVEIDEGSFYWRLGDMILVQRAGEYEGYEGGSGDAEYDEDADYDVDYAEESTGMIKVGSTVVLGRHDELAGSANWTEEMSPFIGKRAKVTEIAGTDSDGFIGVLVEGNTYFWRVRNLTLLGRGKPGSYGYKVGDRVILGRHRPLGEDGNEFWADEMDAYVGMEATITELVGSDEDGSGSFVVHVDVDQDEGGYLWRVETLSPAP